MNNTKVFYINNIESVFTKLQATGMSHLAGATAITSSDTAFDYIDPKGNCHVTTTTDEAKTSEFLMDNVKVQRDSIRIIAFEGEYTFYRLKPSLSFRSDNGKSFSHSIGPIFAVSFRSRMSLPNVAGNGAIPDSKAILAMANTVLFNAMSGIVKKTSLMPDTREPAYIDLRKVDLREHSYGKSILDMVIISKITNEGNVLTALRAPNDADRIFSIKLGNKPFSVDIDLNKILFNYSKGTVSYEDMKDAVMDIDPDLTDELFTTLVDMYSEVFKTGKIKSKDECAAKGADLLDQSMKAMHDDKHETPKDGVKSKDETVVNIGGNGKEAIEAIAMVADCMTLISNLPNKELLTLETELRGFIETGIPTGIIYYNIVGTILRRIKPKHKYTNEIIKNLHDAVLEIIKKGSKPKQDMEATVLTEFKHAVQIIDRMNLRELESALNGLMEYSRRQVNYDPRKKLLLNSILSNFRVGRPILDDVIIPELIDVIREKAAVDQMEYGCPHNQYGPIPRPVYDNMRNTNIRPGYGTRNNDHIRYSMPNGGFHPGVNQPGSGMHDWDLSNMYVSEQLSSEDLTRIMRRVIKRNS